MRQHSDVADIVKAAALINQIKPLLAGARPSVQAVVISDLLATWLAGHGVADDERASQQLRAELLANHLQVVRQLTDIYAKALHGQTKH